MKGADAFGYAYIALVAALIGYAVGRKHGEQAQRDQKRDSDLFNLKSQVSWLTRQVKPDEAGEKVPA